MIWTQHSAHSIPWWHLSAVTDNEPSYASIGKDFRLRFTEAAPLLISAETTRALQFFDSQISRP